MLKEINWLNFKELTYSTISIVIMIAGIYYYLEYLGLFYDWFIQTLAQLQ